MLSGKQVIIKEIRTDDVNPGLKPYEVNLLKLVEKMTNGSEININKTGTRLILRPGIIDSNEGLPIEHNCDLEDQSPITLNVFSCWVFLERRP